LNAPAEREPAPSWDAGNAYILPLIMLAPLAASAVWID
jgi:hypothetical protein